MPISLAKLEANRQNAKLSTGPRTSAGKTRASRNALKHGLLAAGTVMPQESAEAYAELRRALAEDLQPNGALEALLTERVASCLWRLGRAARIETELLTDSLQNVRGWFVKQQSVGAAYAALDDRVATRLNRYEVMLDRQLGRALGRLLEIQAARGESPRAPSPIDIGTKTAAVDYETKPPPPTTLDELLEQCGDGEKLP